MNDFFQSLFRDTLSSQPPSQLLLDYEEEDLANFFSSETESDQKPKSRLLAVAEKILLSGGFDKLSDRDTQQSQYSERQVEDICKQAGVEEKQTEAFVEYVKKYQGQLGAIRKRLLAGPSKQPSSSSSLVYKDMSWSVRHVFFSKKEQFKGQKKYAIMTIDTENKEPNQINLESLLAQREASQTGSDKKEETPKGATSEKLRLTIEKEDVLKIRNKLAALDEQIKDLFSHK